MRFGLVCFLALLTSFNQAYGHDEGPSDVAITSELVSVVIQKFAAMDISETPYSSDNDGAGSQVRLRKVGRVFSLFMGKKHYEFSEKVTEVDEIPRLLSLIWLNEARKACSDCILPDIEILDRHVKNKLNMGAIGRGSVAIGDLAFERYGGIATDIAFRKGPIFAVLKVVGEIIEDFVTGGWHFVCEAITWAIMFVTRPFIFMQKAFTVPKFYGNNRFTTSLRYLSAAIVTRSILKRVDFGIKPFTVNDTNLKDFLEDNEDLRGIHQVANWSAKALNFIRQRGTSKQIKEWSARDQQQKNRVNKFIKGLESQQQKLQAKLDSNGRLTDDEKALLEADIETVVTLKRKSFFGKRLKRTFLLVKRRGAQSSNPLTRTKDLFKNSDFWYVPLEMEILNPHLNYTDDDRRQMQRFDSSGISDETIWMARRVSGDREKVAYTKLLDSVRSVFDESLPKRQRQLLAKRASSLLNTDVTGLMKMMMSQKMQELKLEKESVFQAFGAWFSQIGTRRAFSTFYKILDEYAFYLNFGAVSKDISDDPTLPLHMADHMNNILATHSRIANAFNNVYDKESLREFTKIFDEEIRHLKTTEPWRDKGLIKKGAWHNVVKPIIKLPFMPFSFFINPVVRRVIRQKEIQCKELYSY